VSEKPAAASELSPVKQALLEIRDLNGRLEEIERRRTEPIAIIGVGLRFPGADNLEAFWKLLENGFDAIQEVPSDRWDLDAYFDPQPQTPGKMNTRWGGFLDKIDQFDPGFFGISPREAASLDPQQRLLLETAWEALERAGQSPEQLFGSSTGVFLGISNSDYYRMLLKDIDQIDAYASTGAALSVAGGRLSYTLGLHGPNLAVDTACSSSLVAIHLACKSLRMGETHLALAAGVNAILSPELNVNFSIANMMAPDGRCKTFDADANGYVRGEGCAVLVLKRLSDAIANADPILALIRGSAVNHDGRSGGLTAPNGPAQTAVIRGALADAGVSPDEISYIEAHGTGTPLGDPIEIGALIEAFGQNRPAGQKLYVGSVKTNIGHLEAAAGVAGVVKAVLALQHQQIPPHLHFKALNPHITLENTPIEIPVQNIPWQTPEGKKRLCGVSSFGLSGTNAHIILEEAPAAPLPSDDGGQAEMQAPSPSLHVLTISAKTENALHAAAGQLETHLKTTGQKLEDICYSANTGRSTFNHHLAVLANSKEDAREKLAAFCEGRDEQPGLVRKETRLSTSPEITFLFTGQGSNYVGMGQQLYQDEPVFRATLDACDEILRPHLEVPLLSVLYPRERSGSEEILQDMRYGQPALFAVQMALVNLWKSWGVEPTFAAGHSLGEYAAACMAGVFSLEDALKLVSWRGRLMQSIPQKGRMVAIFATEEQVAAAVAPHGNQVSIAALNAPTNIVISGEYSAVEEIVQRFEEQKVKTRRLAISQASHSPLIEPVLDEYGKLAQTIHYSEPSLGLVSTLTGTIVAPGEITDPSYWPRHIRQPVQFYPAIQTLRDHQQRIFVEIGPNPVLLSLGNRCLPGDQYSWMPSLRENRDDRSQMLESLAGLWTHGVKVNWDGFDRPHQRRRVLLPTYPFQHSRYWTENISAPLAPKTEPVWESAAAAARQQSLQGPLDLQVSSYTDRWDILDRLTGAYILSTFRHLGAYAQPGEAWTAETLQTTFKILPFYHSLMQRWLEKLEYRGFLIRKGSEFTNPASLPRPDLVNLRQEAAAKLADSPMLYEYVERSGERLVSVLTGATSPLDTLFPDGSSRLAEDLYQNWAGSRYYALIVRAAVAAVVSGVKNSGRPIRILELGAGTGATTSHILPILPPVQSVYYFTDVSNLFLGRAAEKFSAFPFVRYETLDIEKSPAEQGIPPHSFDVVIATNVLHAVPSLRQAVQNTLELLSPGGILVLNEVTTHLSWYDITTGLIEGWQNFNDDLRSTSPLLSAAEWQILLQECGFRQVVSWPEQGTSANILGQHVILGLSPSSGLDGRLEFEGTLDTPEHILTASPVKTPEKEDLTAEWTTRLQAVLPGERLEIMLSFVRQKLGRVLRLQNTDNLERSQRLMDLGLDSLMALELRTQLSKGLGLPEKALSATLAFDYPNIQALAAYLLEELQKIAPMDGGNPDAPAAVSTRETEVANLTDDEIEALLIQKLNQQGGNHE
jgi:acyl transferase domain-containing protein/SAM-dependent methyltransferase